MSSPLASAWDAFADMFALFEGTSAACLDCRVALKGPAIRYGGRGMERKHYDDRCRPCEMRRIAERDRPIWESWAAMSGLAQ